MTVLVLALVTACGGDGKGVDDDNTGSVGDLYVPPDQGDSGDAGDAGDTGDSGTTSDLTWQQWVV